MELGNTGQILFYKQIAPMEHYQNHSILHKS